MALTTPSMGLKRWDQPNDVFSYVELSDNFNLLDTHDHTAGKGVQIPTGGIANLSIDTTKLADSSVTPSKIPINTLTSDRLFNSTVLDTKLNSPNNAIWRTLQSVSGVFTAGTTGIVNGFGGGGVIISGANSTSAMAMFPFIATHYAVANKVTKLRVLGSIATNNTAPGITLTLALNPVTASAGNVAQITTTLGAAVAGSGIGAALSASSRYTLAGAEFDVPADGIYALTATASAAQAGTSLASTNVLLQVRYV